jgi:putative protease
MTETKLGKVKHFFGKISVAIVVCEDDSLAVGETIHIKGATTDLTTKVESMQVERQPLTAIEKGKDVAIKVPSKVRPDDIVYKVKE